MPNSLTATCLLKRVVKLQGSRSSESTASPLAGRYVLDSEFGLLETVSSGGNLRCEPDNNSFSLDRRVSTERRNYCHHGSGLCGCSSRHHADKQPMLLPTVFCLEQVSVQRTGAIIGLGGDPDSRSAKRHIMDEPTGIRL